MTFVLVVALAIALFSAVLALGREIQLRKALEKLLNILISRWRAHVSKPEHKDLDSPAGRVDSDRWL